MTSQANMLGQISPGITLLQNAATVSQVISSDSGQILSAIGSNAFSFGSNIPASSGGGVVQQLVFPAPNSGGGSPIPVTITGTQTTTYNSAALFFSCPFTPKLSNSTIKCRWELNAGFNIGASPGNAVIHNGYLNKAGSPVITSIVGDFSVGSGLLASARAFSTIGSNFSGPQTLDICVFSVLNTSTPDAPFDSAAVIIYEMSALPSSPFSISTSSATPVIALNFAVPLNSSLNIVGTWAAFNTDTFSSNNGGNFNLVTSRQTGDVTIVNNVIQNQILPLNVPPYILFVADQTTDCIQIQVVGDGTNNFEFNFYFTSN